MVFINVNRRQYSVGQGGFHSSSITVGEWDEEAKGSRSFEFVYDCGTYSSGAGGEVRAKHIANHISTYNPQGGIVDLLFLSHLDEDHYNGAAQLCATKQVSRLILPYFTAEELCFMLAEQVLRARRTILGIPYVKAMFSIAGGVSNTFLNVPVTWVTPAQDNDGPPQPLDPTLVDVPEGRLAPCVRTPSGALTRLDTVCPAGTSIELADHNGATAVATSWILRPWSYMQSPTAIEAMREIINGCAPLATLLEKGQMVTQGDILALDKQKTLVRSACQKIIRVANGTYAGSAKHPNANSPSLCLYSGLGRASMAASNRRPVHFTAQPGWRPDVGWISTGDALLKRHWPEFKRCYSDVLPKVVTYVVPHHGSVHNHTPELMRAIQKNSCAVICAGHDQAHHPGRAILVDIHTAGHSIALVTEFGKAGFSEYVHVLLRP